MSAKPTVQLMMRIDPEQHRALKLHATRHGTSMQALLERAIEEVILKEPHSPARAQLS